MKNRSNIEEYTEIMLLKMELEKQKNTILNLETRLALTEEQLRLKEELLEEYRESRENNNE